MPSLKLVKKYLIDSQFFVSLMGTLFGVFFMFEERAFRWPTVFLIFITYFSGYIYTKYQNHRLFYKILIINFLCGIISVMLIFVHHHEIRLLKWLVIVILGLFYNSFFLENFVRKIPLLKIFYVGLVWGLVNAWLFLPEFNIEIFLISFLFITALVLPFDIRDMHDDDVVTFPKLIGVQNTKFVAHILCFLATFLAIHVLKTDFKIAFFLTCAATFTLIYFAEPTHRDSYFSFGVELCSGLPFIFLVLIQSF